MTTRRRRLGQLLRTMRETADRSTDDACLRLRCSQPKISRIETGQTLPKIADLEILLAFYGANDEDRDRAIALWEEAREPAAHLDYVTLLPARMRGFSRLEAEASEILTFQPLAAPGLLQTEDYACALHVADQRFCPAEMVNSQVAARMARQRRLNEPDPPMLHAVMGEGVIHTAVGGPVVLRSQLAHLLDMAQRPNVTIQVVPFSGGAYGTMSGPFTILRFPDKDDPPSVYLEYAGGGAWAESKVDMERLSATFADAAKVALSAEETIRFIRRVVRGEPWPSSSGARAAIADR